MKAFRKSDGKQLSTNIAGKYKFNASKNEYIFLSRSFNKNEKKPFNIRIGTYKQTLWINHTDYTAIECDYNRTSDGIYFIFNGIQYNIPSAIHDPVYGDLVTVEKLV